MTTALRTFDQIETRLRTVLRRGDNAAANFLDGDEVELMMNYPELTDAQALDLYQRVVQPFKRGEWK